MKSHTKFIGLALGLATLLAPHASRAEDGRIVVDVVIDFSGAIPKGLSRDDVRKIEKTHIRPTPDKPAYYLPLFVGYKDFGYSAFAKKPEASKAEIENLLVGALASQGYDIMTKEHPPSLVLTFIWGYIAPVEKDMQVYANVPPGQVYNVPSSMANMQGFQQSPNPSSALESIVDREMSPQSDFRINLLALSMVAGDALKDFHIVGDDPRMAWARNLASQPRYYIQITALDFKSMEQRKTILIWQAHISTELVGRSFDEVLSPMIAAASPRLGRESGPLLFSVPAGPIAKVTVGAPVVKQPVKNP